MKALPSPVPRLWLRGVVLCTTCALLACDPLSGAGVFIDCLDDDGPVLSPKILPTPVLNQSYDAIIQASIENEPFDDRFHYRFNVGSGLPQGLSINTFERELRITGAPVVLGDFAVRIEVVVEDAFGQGAENRLCRRKFARNYFFNIVPTTPTPSASANVNATE